MKGLLVLEGVRAHGLRTIAMTTTAASAFYQFLVYKPENVDLTLLYRLASIYLKSAVLK